MESRRSDQFIEVFLLRIAFLHQLWGFIAIGIFPPGKFLWITYKEVYDVVLEVGNSIHSCGIEEGGRYGIYGTNSPEWIMSMEDLHSQLKELIPEHQVPTKEQVDALSKELRMPLFQVLQL